MAIMSKSRGTSRSDRGRGRVWNDIQTRGAGRTMSDRDIFDSQNVHRTTLKGKTNPKPRLIAAAIVSAFLSGLIWAAFSGIQMLVHWGRESLNIGPSYDQTEYVGAMTDKTSGVREYYQLDATGEAAAGPYPSAEDVPVPSWLEQATAADQLAHPAPDTLTGWMFDFSLMKVATVVIGGLLIYVVLRTALMKQIEVQDQSETVDDIIQTQDDQHLSVPEETIHNFNLFPDAGAHSGVVCNSLISHVTLSNNGINKVDFGLRHEADVVDEDGEILFYKGELMYDDEGQVMTTRVPMFDDKFADMLFESAEVPDIKVDGKPLRRRFDPKKIDYNSSGKRQHGLDHKMVSDLVNEEWELPLYEPQRPAGAYVVDSSPVNTMVIAITRGGKGQTYIEPMIDLWSREKKQNNMVVNDPKMELLAKFYVPLMVRGYDVVQINLMAPDKTDVFNPVSIAAQNVRDGNVSDAATIIDNIAAVFFPADGGQERVWTDAARNAFNRAAHGLVDFYIEEEAELRQYALDSNMPASELETRLDHMWGKVSLYNCYQFFVNLTSRKLKDPVMELEGKRTEYEAQQNMAEFDRLMEVAKKEQVLWEGRPEQDLFSMFFAATEMLPMNEIRKLVINAHNSLKAMAGADRMLASVYGIAITQMSFFTTPVISKLTSGTASQNIDLGAMAFPRRIGVRFPIPYLEHQRYQGAVTQFDAFSDPNFTESLGEEFTYTGNVSREGWARGYFEGIFPEDVAYIRLRLLHKDTNMLMKSFYFRFNKGYRTSLDGRLFVKNPITGDKMVHDGILIEMLPETDPETREVVSYAVGQTMRKVKQVEYIDGIGDEEGSWREVERQIPAVHSTQVRYTERPKAMFMITPPHLPSYTRLVLILLKQMVDLNFEASYLTRGDQKPQLKTRYMLDELGNFQSDGNGISGFQSMLSIGLGQDQQFTAILQNMQQLREIYGDSVDRIIRGNTANIVFIKSNDDEMCEVLSEMSGKHRVGYRSGKSVTQRKGAVVKALANERQLTYNYSTEDKSLISKNQLMKLPDRDSVCFFPGDLSTVWNHNEMRMPMAKALHKNQIMHNNMKYVPRNVPSTSTANEFNVTQNQPDFGKMLEKRKFQAMRSELMQEKYREARNITEVDVSRMDIDIYSSEIMAMIRRDAIDRDMITEGEAQKVKRRRGLSDDAVIEFSEQSGSDTVRRSEPDTDFMKAKATSEVQLAKTEALIFADKQLSRSAVNPSLDGILVDVVGSMLPDLLADEDTFMARDGDLYDNTGRHLLVRATGAAPTDEDGVYGSDAQGRVHELGEGQIGTSVVIEKAFYTYMRSMASWDQVAGGRFEAAMAAAVSEAGSTV